MVKTFRFRLIADFEFDAPNAEGAALALGAHFASLASSTESPISPEGGYLIECTDVAYVASLSPEQKAETKRTREEIVMRLRSGRSQ